VSTFTITSTPGYNTERDQHSVELNFALKGTRGVLVWQLALGIVPLGFRANGTETGRILYDVNLAPPSDMGCGAHTELDEHSASDTESAIHENCEYLDGRACVGTYWTGQAGSELFPALATEGIEGVRRVLEQKYLEHYGEPA
jgi:hypothetical protein